jgi:hypothetical protein
MGLHIDTSMSFVNFSNTHAHVQVSATLNDSVFSHKKVNWLIMDRDEITVYKHIRRGVGRLRLKCNGTHAETRFRLSSKRTSPFKLAGTSVQSTAGRRDVRYQR